MALRYVSGYADAASVPEAIKSYIKLVVGGMYENREAEQLAGKSQMPVSMKFVDALLDKYKVYQ